MSRHILLSITSLVFAVFVCPAESQQANARATVPFVGCKSDGQVGPRRAPGGRVHRVNLPPETAQHLAFYRAQDTPGVLAPRNWFCFSTYGSSGSTLYVTRTPIRSADVFSYKWAGFTGPAIQLSISISDTSGRFEVAQIIARVFPAHRHFVQKLMSETLQPPSHFPFGRDPTSHL